MALKSRRSFVKAGFDIDHNAGSSFAEPRVSFSETRLCRENHLLASERCQNEFVSACSLPFSVSTAR